MRKLHLFLTIFPHVLLSFGLIMGLCGVMQPLYAQQAPAQPAFRDTTAIMQAIKTADGMRENTPEAAEQTYQTTMAASRKLGYRRGIANSLSGLARCNLNRSEQEKALAYCREALTYCDNDVAGHEMTASLHMFLSEIFYYKSRYDSCAFYRYTALAEVDKYNLSNSKMLIRIYCGILQFWLNAHDDIRNDMYVREVVQRINKLERTALAAKDSQVLSTIYFHKAGYYNNIGQNDSARFYCNKHLEIAQYLKVSPSMKVATYMNIAITYLDEKRPVEALHYLDLGEEAIPYQGRNLSRYLIYSSFFRGEAYCQQGLYAKAIEVTQPALMRANELGLFQITDRAYKTLGTAYEGTGQYKNAAEYREKYAIVRDSLTRVQKLEMMYDMEIKYRISDKDKELAKKELAIARTEASNRAKNFWIGGISAGLVLILVISILMYRNYFHKQKLQKVTISNLSQQVKIAGLQAMINGEEKERRRIARDLHDGLGGNLSAVRLLLSSIFRKYRSTDVSTEFKDVLQMLEEASSELRKTAHNLMPETLLQEGLVKAVTVFCERISKGHSLELSCSSLGKERRLPEEMELSIYRIIQELLHNIIKHSAATEALVQMVYHDSQLCITVEDNGCGIPDTLLKGAGGIGLRTIRERLRLMKGQLDIAANSGEGTSIYMEVNIPAATPTLNPINA